MDLALADRPTRAVAGFAGRLRRLVAPVYVPALAAGLAVQVAAIAVRSVWLAVTGLCVGALADLCTGDGGLRLRTRLHDVGVTAPLRTTLRGVLLLAAATSASEGMLVGAVTMAVAAAALVGIVAGAILHEYALHRVVDFAPALAVRNLGANEALTRLLPSLAARRYLGTAALLGLEIPVAVVVAVPVGMPNVAVGMLAGIGGLAAAGGIAAALWVRRLLRSGRIPAYRRALADELRQRRTEIVVHFSGDPGTTYQLTAWLPVFEQLERPTVIVVREREHLAALGATRWPVVLAERPADLEVLLAADPAIVLYVANAGRNLHSVRYPRMKHLFLNHGDSDKASSANPVVKMYDRLLVAGPVGVRRYRDAGIDLPDDRVVTVGRPQLDGVLDGRGRCDEGPTTVLYAPTWEGYVDAADYTSVDRLGPAVIERLLHERPDIRIVFKPHPFTGARRGAAAGAVRRITALLREAPRSNGVSHVVAGDRPDIDLYGWFNRCDVLLTDVSAVASDFLHTDKPLLVTNPRRLEDDELAGRFPSVACGYIVGDASDVVRLLDVALDDDPLAADRSRMRRDVLGDHPEGPLASFMQAVDDAVAWSRADAQRIRTTYGFE